MIIRKPYAFMIKHFKMLHLILLAFMAFIFMNVNSIHSLFTKLVTTNTSVYSGATSYINTNINLFLILTAALAFLIHMLLNSKKKKTIIYIGTVIYMIGLFVAFIYLNSRLKLIADTPVDVSKISLFNDISFLIGLPAYPLMLIFFLRGLGLNIKQFNFNKDIKDLELSEEDSEEIELTLSNNTYKIFRFIRRFIRELKYYYLEHTLVFSTLIVLSFLVLTGFGINYYRDNLQANATNVVSMVDGISYSVQRSYVTSKDYNGKEIKKGYKYIVVELGFTNVTGIRKTIDSSIITLVNNDLIYYSTATYNNRFYDLGEPYSKDMIFEPNTTYFKTITFEVPYNVNANNFVLRIYSGMNIKSGLKAMYKRFNINPQNIDTKQKEKIYYLGDTITNNVVNKNDIELTFSKYEIKDVYKYTYVSCKEEGDCRTLSKIVTPSDTNSSTLLILDLKSIIDEDANFYKKFNNINKFMENYATVQYSTSARFKEQAASLVEDDFINDKVIIEVNRDLLKSSIINLFLNFRDEKAKVSIKGSPTVALISNGIERTYSDLHRDVINTKEETTENIEEAKENVENA